MRFSFGGAFDLRDWHAVKLVFVFTFLRQQALLSLRQTHGEVFYRFVISIKQTCAEVSRPSTVDNRGANDVLPFVECEPLGDAIVNDRLAVAINPYETAATKMKMTATRIFFIGLVLFEN